MKNLDKQLSLSTTTIDILNDKALENVKGGAIAHAIDHTCMHTGCEKTQG